MIIKKKYKNMLLKVWLGHINMLDRVEMTIKMWIVSN